MAAGDPAIPAMREERLSIAGGALGRGVDSLVGNPAREEATPDGAGEVDRFLPARMGAPERRVELARDIRTHWEATGVNAGSDHGVEFARRACLGEPADGLPGDSGLGAAPAGMKERSVSPVRRDDGDGGAVGRRHRYPRLARANEESVRLGPCFAVGDELGPVNLIQERGRRTGVSQGAGELRPIPRDRVLVVTDAEAHVERGERSHAPSATPGRHAEPGAGWEGVDGRAPEGERVVVSRNRCIVRHARKGARRPDASQGNCVRAALASAAILVGLVIGSGCARVPVAASGADARDRFLAERVAAGGPVRGVGEIDADFPGRGGSFEARWGSAGESLVVIGYAGPVRILDASLLGDSLFIGVRREDFGVAGLVRPSEGVGSDAIRFLLRPWDFGAPWVREALERAAVEPVKEGWRLRGEGESASGPISFSLDISAQGEPRRLELSGRGADRPLAVVRYGPLRGYAAGRYPRWIEWNRGKARVRLDVREVGPLPDGRLRLLPPAPAEWRIVALDDPEGRSLVKRLIGDETDSGQEESR